MPWVNERHWGSTLDWAFVLSAVLSVVILLCLGLARLRYRGRQMEIGALGMHFLSLVILPLFLFPVVNFTVFEYATRVEFCGSCHRPMAPYIEGLRAPGSPSLAALHFQNRVAPGTACYACHADYGIHGTLEAKVAGIRHLLRYITGDYSKVLTIREPFKNELCLKCHAGAKRFMAQEVHLEGGRVAPALVGEQIRCIACHAPAHDARQPRAMVAPVDRPAS